MHFNLLVRIEGSCPEAELEARLAAILAPLDDSDNSPYNTVFVDITEEYMDRYNNESIEQVILPSGEMVYPHDHQFFNYDTFQHDHGDLPTKLAPFHEVYSSFEEFAKKFAGLSPNEAGRYGHWNNPNGRLSEWRIGGHYKLMLCHKNGNRVDFLRIRELDIDKHIGMAQIAALSFLRDWEDFLDIDSRNGIGKAMALGLARHYENESELTGNELFTREPALAIDRVVFEEEILGDCLGYFNTLSTVSRLSWNSEWLNRDLIDPFTHTPEAVSHLKKYCNETIDWIECGDPDDWVIMVDCCY